MPDSAVPPLPAASEAALADGRIIEAIKILRQSEKLSLVAAKGRIDAHLARDPDLERRVREKAREVRRRMIKWVLVADGVIALLVLYWFFGRQ